MKIPPNAEQIEKLMHDITGRVMVYYDRDNDTMPEWVLLTMASVLTTVANPDRILSGQNDDLISPYKLVDICTMRQARGPKDVVDRIFTALNSLRGVPATGEGDVMVVQALLAILSTILARRSGDRELGVSIARGIHQYLGQSLNDKGRAFMLRPDLKPTNEETK